MITYTPVLAAVAGTGNGRDIQMAKNVKVAVDLFRQRWFRQLTTDKKVLWLHLMCESDLVGVFEIDSESWNFNCKPTNPYADGDAFSAFGNRIQRIPNHPDKGIVVGKLDYQRTFTKSSTQWQWVVRALANVDLTYEKLAEMNAHAEEQLELALEEPPATPKPEKNIRFIIPPKREWVADYCAERGKGVDPVRFFDFYSSKGWKIGKNSMKDWQAAVRTWEDDGKSNSKPCAVPVTNQPIRKAF